MAENDFAFPFDAGEAKRAIEELTKRLHAVLGQLEVTPSKSPADLALLEADLSALFREFDGTVNGGVKVGQRGVAKPGHFAAWA